MEKQLWHSCKNPLCENLIWALSGVCTNLWAGTHWHWNWKGLDYKCHALTIWFTECKNLAMTSTGVIPFRARKKVLGFFPTWSISAVRNHKSDCINVIMEIRVISNQNEMKGKYINTAMNADVQFITAHFLCAVRARDIQSRGRL